MSIARLMRITDLFREGAELELGEEDGTAVVVWVNKLNSFEEEESRKDGAAARAMRMLELNNNNPEIIQAQREMETWSHDDLAHTVSQQSAEEDYVKAIDDVEADEKWKDKLETVRRMETLMEDAKLSDDDPKRETYEELKQEYWGEVTARLDKRLKDRVRELKDLSERELADKFIDGWRNRNALGEFLKEQKVTQIFFALRDCQGVKRDKGWEHAACVHDRLLPDRKSVRELPEELLERVTGALVELTVDRRTAGNLDAPTSSSESLGPQNPEAESTPSIPVVMPVAAQ